MSTCEGVPILSQLRELKLLTIIFIENKIFKNSRSTYETIKHVPVISIKNIFRELYL